MIEVQSLSKAYGSYLALKDVSFRVAEQEIVGLLGPNGAGKTTILKILTGYLQPDEGSVSVDGIDVVTDTRDAQARIGYLPENAPLYPELSVQSYLKLIAELRGIPRADLVDCLSEAVYATGLQDRLTQPIGQLSKGFRQRVGLAQAILNQPRLLILDEPSVGLDPTQIVEMRYLIKRLAAHSTVLFSTHILSEVEAICDRVIILINGEVRADARLADLRTSTDAILVLDSPVKEVVYKLRRLSGVHGVMTIPSEFGHPSYRITGNDGSDLCPTVYGLARDLGWPIRELRADRQTLETIFAKLAA